MEQAVGAFLVILLYLAIPAAILAWAMQVLWTLRGIRAALEGLAYGAEPQAD